MPARYAQVRSPRRRTFICIAPSSVLPLQWTGASSRSLSSTLQACSKALTSEINARALQSTCSTPRPRNARPRSGGRALRVVYSC